MGMLTITVLSLVLKTPMYVNIEAICICEPDQ